MRGRRCGTWRAIRSFSAPSRGGVTARHRRVCGELLRGDVVAIELWAPGGERLARAGSPAAVAAAGSEIVAGGAPPRRCSPPRSPRREASQPGSRRSPAWRPPFSSPAARWHRRFRPRDARCLASASGPPRSTSAGEEYRGRMAHLSAPAGPPVVSFECSRPRPRSPACSRQPDVDRASSWACSCCWRSPPRCSWSARSTARSDFLDAARRLSAGDFRHPVPTEGGDEFAALGREFNNMSEQLEAKIDEVERKRRELEETIRRVGDAFASGLDRRGVVELAVRQAVDACEAEAGRALPLARAPSRDTRSARPTATWSGRSRPPSATCSPSARTSGQELLGALEGDERAQRHAARACPRTQAGAHALSIGLRLARSTGRSTSARSRSPGAARRSRARRGSCSSTWPARRPCRSRTRPPRDRAAPGGHRRADRAWRTSARFHVDAGPRDRAKRGASAAARPRDARHRRLQAA